MDVKEISDDPVKSNKRHDTCCVPLCTNNSRNSPNLKFHSIPNDEKRQRQYVHLIRNKNLTMKTLKERGASNVRLCGKHWVGDVRKCKEDLPSVFPWTKNPAKSRIVKLRPYKERPQTSVNTGQDDKETPGENLMIESDNVEVGDSSQVVSMQQEMEKLRAELESLRLEKKEAEHLRSELERVRREKTAAEDELKRRVFRVETFSQNAANIRFYTGLPTYGIFTYIFKRVQDKAMAMSYGGYDRKVVPDGKTSFKAGAPKVLSLENELFLTLVKLRLNLLEQDLAHRFGISVSSVSRILNTWLRLLGEELKVFIQFPTREEVDENLPKVFQSYCPDVRAIIDCLEVRMESPSSLDMHSAVYSDYKSTTTMKGLLACTPTGIVCGISRMMTGSVSDNKIFSDTDIVKHLKRGDSLMADRGFTIQDELAHAGARLEQPAFLRGRVQFNEKELTKSQLVAALRIHVERCIQRVKNYRIFQGRIPITMKERADDIFLVCAALANFLPPLVTE